MEILWKRLDVTLFYSKRVKKGSLVLWCRLKSLRFELKFQGASSLVVRVPKHDLPSVFKVSAQICGESSKTSPQFSVPNMLVIRDPSHVTLTRGS